MATVFGVVVVMARLAAHRAMAPQGFEWLTAAGPALVAFVAVMTAANFIFGPHRHCSRARIYSALMGVSAILVAPFLTIFHTPLLHLLILLLLFSIFWIWDRAMVKFTNVAPEAKAEIWTANRYINVPTIVAVTASLAVIGLMLWLGGDLRPITDGFVHCDEAHTVKNEAGRWIMTCMTSDQVRTAFISAWVNGLVSFHLFISAAAYLFTTHLAPAYNRWAGIP